MLPDITRRLPIGVQSFESLRKAGYLYVDKTRYIYALVHTSKQYFLSRPRRFGKSLFLSTLRAYWEGKKELFAGLDIAALEKDSPDAWQPCPVFYFDFNRDSFQRTQALEGVIEAHLEEWERIYGRVKEDASLAIRFQNLLVRAVKKTGRKAVVLVDEYDKPLLETLEIKDLQKQNKEVLKGFFTTLKSFDAYLQFVFITGVTKFSKVSIFSDLNQLEDISMDEEYAAVCGITEGEMKQVFMPEIDSMAEKHGMSREECLAKLKRTYDGYHFNYEGEGVYNPFSLLNALKKRQFDSYWFETGTPTFLIRKLTANGFDVRRFTNRTLYANGRTISNYTADNPDLLPLLYQTGYLTIIDADMETGQLTLGFPNDEVKYGFMESLLLGYTPEAVASGNDIFSLNHCLKLGDTEGVKEILTSLLASLPYSSGKTPVEQYFEVAVYLIFTLLGRITKSEVHSARGRADCIVETQEFVYVFKFKLDKSADEALAQIKEKGYAMPYAADKRQLYKIGVNFDSKERNITEWKVGD